MKTYAFYYGNESQEIPVTIRAAHLDGEEALRHAFRVASDHHGTTRVTDKGWEVSTDEGDLWAWEREI